MNYVVVTGASGYIGQALSKRLALEGRALRLVSRYSQARGIDTGKHLQHVQADLCDDSCWCDLMEDAAAIVHLSSRTDLRAAEADAAGDRGLNVEPIHALVRAAERRGIRMPVIFASTVTIVGDAHANPVNEDTPDRPCSVYDRHKLECEMILREATCRGVLRACSLRLSNVYGYGGGVSSVNSNRGILNTLMLKACRGEALTLYGQGEYIRDFVFIGDVVDAFSRALASEVVLDGNHYVIASGRGYSLLEAFELVVQEALRCTGHQVEIQRVPTPENLHPIERRNFVGDSGLFQRLTGWYPQVDLEAGIRDYFERVRRSSQS